MLRGKTTPEVPDDLSASGTSLRSHSGEDAGGESDERDDGQERAEEPFSDFDGEAEGTSVADESSDEKEFPESDPDAQPLGQNRVPEDMATLVLNPGYPQSAQMADQDGALLLHPTGDFAGLEDSTVMLELKAGNLCAFDFLLAKYRKPMIHFMYRMTHNQAVAEELAQEVFLRIYRSRETYRAEARFSTWLYRIATNLGVNHARDTRHERTASTVYLDETDSETGTRPDVADSTPGAESKLLQRERMQAIKEIVMELPERQRMGVLMHKYEGMDYKQIGEILKLSESATKSLLFRAYQTLREKLKAFA